MPVQDLLDSLLDAVAIDSAGVKIGAVRQVYVDDGTGKATFVSVATGVFSADAIVPLHGARLLDRELHVDHTRQSVREAPRLDDTDDGLTPDQEAELLEHYGVELPRRGSADDSVQKADGKSGPTESTPATTSTTDTEKDRKDRPGSTPTQESTPEKTASTPAGPTTPVPGRD